MKRFFAAAFFILASSAVTVNTMAQVGGPPNYGPPIGPTSSGPDISSLDFFHSSFPTNANAAVAREYVPQEKRVLTKGVLAASIEDRQALAAFLRTRNTGLIRLLPRMFSGNRNRRKFDQNIRGGGAYYSFAALTHYYGGSDIELDRNNLSVGFAGADYGMLTNLGSVSLETISADDPEAEFIANYKPPESVQQALAEAGRFATYRVHSEGGRDTLTGNVVIDGRVYSRSIPVEEAATYLLRSIVYNRSDVLVAFRVVRKDTDGSVIIAWKLLKKYAKPRLVREQ